MSNDQKLNQLLELLVHIRNSCHHPDSNPQAIIAAALATMGELRKRWEAENAVEHG